MLRIHTCKVYILHNTKLLTYHWNIVFGSSNYKAQHSNRFNKAWHYIAICWKKDHQIASAIRFYNQYMKIQIQWNLVMHLQSNANIHGHTIQHQSHQSLQKSVLSDHSSYLRPTTIRYILTRQWYHKTKTDPARMKENSHPRIKQGTHLSILKPLRMLPHS